MTIPCDIDLTLVCISAVVVVVYVPSSPLPTQSPVVSFSVKVLCSHAVYHTQTNSNTVDIYCERDFILKTDAHESGGTLALLVPPFLLLLFIIIHKTKLIGHWDYARRPLIIPNEPVVHSIHYIYYLFLYI